MTRPVSGIWGMFKSLCLFLYWHTAVGLQYAVIMYDMELAAMSMGVYKFENEILVTYLLRRTYPLLSPM